MSFGALRLGAGHPQDGPGALLCTPVTDGFDVDQEGAILPSCHACGGRRADEATSQRGFLQTSKVLILSGKPRRVPVKVHMSATFDQLGAG